MLLVHLEIDAIICKQELNSIHYLKVEQILRNNKFTHRNLNAQITQTISLLISRL